MPTMKSAIVKRSVELNGHKTSVSLEDDFWTALRRIAQTQSLSLPELVQAIDATRGDANLSSAIRVYVLTWYRTLVAERNAAGEPQPDPRLPPPRPLRD